MGGRRIFPRGTFCPTRVCDQEPMQAGARERTGLLLSEAFVHETDLYPA
jgi:hypothetical protein